MYYEYLIAGRHLRSMRGRKRVSLTVLVAVTGVMLGVCALVIVLSVSNGFSSLVWERLLALNAHLTVRRADGMLGKEYGATLEKLAAHPEVVAASPFVQAQGFVLRPSLEGETYNSGVVVRGVDPEGVLKVSEISSYLWGGEIDLGPQESEGRGQVYGMVIGRYLADRLGALPGSEIHLGMLPEEFQMTEMPRLWRYRVTGIFNTGNPEFDAGLVLISLSAAQRDLDCAGEVTGIRVRLYDPYAAERVAEDLALGELVVFPWTQDNSSLYFSITLEKWASFLALGLIVVVAGFNIISILTMNVAERRREIGILKTMGVAPRSIGRVFTLQGLAIGLVGVLLGNLLGFSLCWAQAQYKLLKIPGEVLIVNALPVEMHLFDFGMISLAAVVVCYLFTLRPAREAARLDPVEAIRM